MKTPNHHFGETYIITTTTLMAGIQLLTQMAHDLFLSLVRIDIETSISSLDDNSPYQSAQIKIQFLYY